MEVQAVLSARNEAVGKARHRIGAAAGRERAGAVGRPRSHSYCRAQRAQQQALCAHRGGDDGGSARWVCSEVECKNGGRGWGKVAVAKVVSAGYRWRVATTETKITPQVLSLGICLPWRLRANLTSILCRNLFSSEFFICFLFFVFSPQNN